MSKRKIPLDTGIVSQVRRALNPRARLATSIGFFLGGFVPLATFVLAHAEAGAFGGHERVWALVAGGLSYSAKTVYDWAKLAFTSTVKSIGFCVLLEGVMVTSSTRWLSLAALCYLIVINGVATGCTLSVRRIGK